jgi:hypothetical protein
MVVDNFNLCGLTRFPAEADSPLVIHPDAVLATPVSGKFFQAVPRRDSEIFNGICTIKEIEFALGKLLKRQGKSFDPLSIESPFCVPVSKGFDHRIAC